MNQPDSDGRRDPAALVLSWIVPLLPDSRREWGDAMEAELAGIRSAVDRWRFASGCALAIASRPAPGRLASLVVPVGVVLATLLLTSETGYLPLRFGLIAMIVLLSVLYLVGDRSAFFARPRRASRLPSVVRTGAAVTLGCLALGVVLSDRSGDGNVVDRATAGVPIFTALVALYLVGFMSLTAPALADTRVLVGGVSLGLTAAATWLAFAASQPPFPLSSRSAFGVLAIAILAAAVIGAAHQKAFLTALCATLVGALSLFLVAHVALAYGPASWVPSDTAALTPAARLAQSRVEAGESYLQVLLIGAIAALFIFAIAYRKHRRSEFSAPQSRTTAPIA